MALPREPSGKKTKTQQELLADLLDKKWREDPVGQALDRNINTQKTNTQVTSQKPTEVAPIKQTTTPEQQISRQPSTPTPQQPIKQPPTQTTNTQIQQPAQQGAYKPLGAFNDAAMSKEDRAQVDEYKQKWAAASGADEKAYWHDMAEGVRKKYGYSGGVDGSQYNKFAPLDNVTNTLMDKLLNGNTKNADDIYEQFMDIYNQESTAPRIISDAEGMAKAKDRYNTIYNDAFDRSMRNIDKNALRTGFYGQLPIEKLKSEAAANIESQRAGSINDLANELVAASRSANFSGRSLDMQEKGMQASLLSNAIQNWTNLTNQEIDKVKMVYDMLSYEDQKDWDREMQKAGITGQWRGQDTMQKQSFNFDKAVAEAGLTGMWKGAPTWQREQAERSLNIAAANAARAASGGISTPDPQDLRKIKSGLVKDAHDMAVDQMKTLYGEQSMQEMMDGSGSERMKSEYMTWYNHYLQQLGAEDILMGNDEFAGYVENVGDATNRNTGAFDFLTKPITGLYDKFFK